MLVLWCFILCFLFYVVLGGVGGIFFFYFCEKNVFNIYKKKIEFKRSWYYFFLGGGGYIR